MYPVLLKADPSGKGCPFSCPAYLEKGGAVEYRRGDCPVADDLFDRNVLVWLDPGYDDSDCETIARGINKVLSAYCKEDPHGRPWI
jgi:hypothetical protein